MSRRSRQTLQLLAILLVPTFLGYLFSRAPVKIVGPLQWDKLTTDGLHAMATGDINEAERLFLRALHEAERTPQIRIGRPTNLQNLGDLRFL